MNSILVIFSLLLVGVGAGGFFSAAFAQTQSSAPRSEEIPMDDIEDDDNSDSPETAEVEEPEVIVKPKAKKQLKASLGKDVDGTRALDIGEFEAQTLGVSHYKKNGVALEVDPD